MSCLSSHTHAHTHSLHEDIKCALRWSSEGVGSEGVESEGTPTCQEVLTPALMCALIGDEEWRGLVVKAEKRSLKYAKSLGVYVQVGRGRVLYL